MSRSIHAIAIHLSLLAFCQATSAQDVEENFARGRKSYDDKNYNEAIGHFRHHYYHHPCSLALNRIGDCYYALKNYHAAVAEYTRAIDQDNYFTPSGDESKDRAISHQWRAHSYNMLGKYRDAIPDYDVAIRRFPRDGELHYFRGLALLYCDDFSKSIDAFSKSLEFDYDKREWAFAHRGQSYARLGQDSRAFEHFSEAILLDPYESYSYLSRVILLLSCGNFHHAIDEAERDLRREGSLDESSQWMAILGHMAYARLGKLTQSRRILRDSAQRCSPSTWPSPIARFLLDELSEETIRDVATDPQKTTDLQLVFALQAAIANQKDKSLKHLDWIIKYGARNCLTRQLALSEQSRPVFNIAPAREITLSRTAGSPNSELRQSFSNLRYRPVRQRPYKDRQDDLELLASPEAIPAIPEFLVDDRP